MTMKQSEMKEELAQKEHMNSMFKEQLKEASSREEELHTKVCELELTLSQERAALGDRDRMVAQLEIDLQRKIAEVACTEKLFAVVIFR